MEKPYLRQVVMDTVSAFSGTDFAEGRTGLLQAVGSCPMKEEVRSGLQKQCYLKV